MKIVLKFRNVIAIVLICAMVGINAMPAQAFTSESNKKSAEQLTPVMGSTTVSIGQMINYYTANEVYPSYYAQVNSDAPNIYEFCKIFAEECRAEGVRTEVAFAQTMKETGFLRFRGDVKITQFNFSGLGATGNGAPGNSFSTVRIGVRAQIQHLKAYASKDPLVNPCVDTRFSYVQRGCAPYVEWLGQGENPTGTGWATAKNYGYSIVEGYMSKLASSSSFTSWYQGKNYSSIYNPDYYMLHNPDVINQVGYSADALISHFINYGMREGRNATSAFSVYAYKARYKDLRLAFGNDLASYYLHYLNSGVAEGRVATGNIQILDGVTVYKGIDYAPVYNYSYYIKRYPDIAAAFPNNDVLALEHFVTSGMNEKRQGSIKFDVISYKNRYVDLRNAFREDIKSYYLHYLSNGEAEGRIATNCATMQNPVTIYEGINYASIFDYNYYTSRYPDIKNAYGDNDMAVLQHFVHSGINEGRQGIKSFNVQSYQLEYADLRRVFTTDIRSYYMHYVSNGIMEGRHGTGCVTLQGATSVYNGVDYSDVYNYYDYIVWNADVKNAFGNNDLEVLQHFVTHGMNEGRKGNSNFNVHNYKSYYQDLQNAFGNDMKSYYLHYIQSGKFEGRIAK